MDGDGGHGPPLNPSPAARVGGSRLSHCRLRIFSAEPEFAAAPPPQPVVAVTFSAAAPPPPAAEGEEDGFGGPGYAAAAAGGGDDGAAGMAGHGKERAPKCVSGIWPDRSFP